MVAVTGSPIREGLPYPLGATWDGKGVNFALFSAHATRVELCLFEDEGERETARIELPWDRNQRGKAVPDGVRLRADVWIRLLCAEVRILFGVRRARLHIE
jgi:pullulanase/glycogen debranching enzyme